MSIRGLSVTKSELDELNSRNLIFGDGIYRRQPVNPVFAPIDVFTDRRKAQEREHKSWDEETCSFSRGKEIFRLGLQTDYSELSNKSDESFNSIFHFLRQLFHSWIFAQRTTSIDLSHLQIVFRAEESITDIARVAGEPFPTFHQLDPRRGNINNGNETLLHYFLPRPALIFYRIRVSALERITLVHKQ